MLKNILIAILLIAVLAGLTVATLVSLKVIKFGSEPAAKQAKVPEGSVPVPVSARAISAYERITRDDLIDAKTGKVQTVNLVVKPEKANPAIRDLSEIIGRVLKRPKAPGYVFTEADFYPKGTQAGEAAGVPVGKRALVLDVNRAAGLREMKPGNRIDLVAAQLIDPKTEVKAAVAVPGGARQAGGAKRATFRVLAENAIVVTPATTRQVPVTSAGGLTSGSQTKNKPIEEVMIAIDPEEVPKLAEALATGAQITCFLHSGQPREADADNGNIPEEKPTAYAPPAPAKPQVIEKVVGKKREFFHVQSGAGQQAHAETQPGATQSDGGLR
jgi:Flp pilus assembly protein CpaB